MKTKILTLLSILISSQLVLGQSSSSNGSVTLNLKLYPINTLIVNSSEDHKVVNLEYKTKEDYSNGVSSTKENHLTIYSTGGYQINVQSSASELTNSIPSTSGNISTNSIEIIPSGGSTIPEGVQFFKSPLLVSESPIVKSNFGGVNNQYTIEYKGKGGNEYLNKYISGQESTTFSTNVIYTIVSK